MIIQKMILRCFFFFKITCPDGGDSQIRVKRREDREANTVNTVRAQNIYILFAET